MGLFWNKNKQDILPKVNELKGLVTNYSGKNGVIKINAKVVVPSGFYFIIGHKGKVTDKFDEGEHFLTFATLPYTCRKLAIDKIKDGKQKDKFSCQYYFVNKGLNAGQFKTYRRVTMGTKTYGIYKIHVYGMYSYRVSNVSEFMQSLLNEFDYIKNGEAENIVEAWVNDLIVGVLEKNNFVITDVINNSPIIAEKLKIAISKMFVRAGLELVELKIYKYKLPKQFQESSDKILNGQNEKTKDLEVKNLEISNINNIDVQIDNTGTNKLEDLDELIKENKPLNSFNYVPFGNLTIDSAKEMTFYNSQEILEENNNKIENNSNQIDHNNLDCLNKINKNEELNLTDENLEFNQSKFVDLEKTDLYKSTNNLRCYKCGGENPPNSRFCNLCGEKIKGDNFYDS